MIESRNAMKNLYRCLKHPRNSSVLLRYRITPKACSSSSQARKNWPRLLARSFLIHEFNIKINRSSLLLRPADTARLTRSARFCCPGLPWQRCIFQSWCWECSWVSPLIFGKRRVRGCQLRMCFGLGIWFGIRARCFLQWTWFWSSCRLFDFHGIAFGIKDRRWKKWVWLVRSQAGIEVPSDLFWRMRA